MNRKDVVELGDKYTTIDTRGDGWFSLPVWALNKLIAEVEQATLERAAKVCDVHAESHAKSATVIEEGGDDAHSVWAMATASKFAGAKIRALKDSHD